MPTYEYRCEKCGHEFEAFQSMTEDPLKECPQCGGKVKRLISPGAGLIFKGSGFYITDYKNQKTSPAAAGGSGDKASKDKAEKKKDQPEAKKESGKKDTGKKSTKNE